MFLMCTFDGSKNPNNHINIFIPLADSINSRINYRFISFFLFQYRKEGRQIYSPQDYQAEGLNTARYTVHKIEELPLYTWVYISLGKACIWGSGGMDEVNRVRFPCQSPRLENRYDFISYLKSSITMITQNRAPLSLVTLSTQGGDSPRKPTGGPVVFLISFLGSKILSWRYF